MKDKIKRILLINLIFLIYSLNLYSDELIIPLKKPVTTSETLKKIIISNFLIPPKKPVIIGKEIIKSNSAQKKSEKKIINGLIIPKSKPIIVVKDKAVIQKKSKYFSEKDFKIANQAIKLMEKRKWFEALKVAKKAKNKSIYNFIQWNHLITTGNRASFFDYREFIDRNKDYPRMGRVKYLSEHKLSTEIISPKRIIKYFEIEKPLSGFGELILGESYIISGEIEKGINFIKKGWIRADLSKT